MSVVEGNSPGERGGGRECVCVGCVCVCVCVCGVCV